MPMRPLGSSMETRFHADDNECAILICYGIGLVFLLVIFLGFFLSWVMHIIEGREI